MTDKEMLVLAAKVEGIKTPYRIDDYGIEIGFEGNQWNGFPVHWNPIRDKQQAMELSTKLPLHVVADSVREAWSLPSGKWERYCRLIAAAAAEIGKAM